MQRDAARMRARAMLPQINSLPRSQCELTVMDGDGQVHRRQRGADVRDIAAPIYPVFYPSGYTPESRTLVGSGRQPIACTATR